MGVTRAGRAVAVGVGWAGEDRAVLRRRRGIGRRRMAETGYEVTVTYPAGIGS